MLRAGEFLLDDGVVTHINIAVPVRIGHRTGFGVDASKLDARVSGTDVAVVTFGVARTV